MGDENKNINLFAFSQGLAEEHNESVNEDILYNKAIDARSGVGELVADWIGRVVYASVTGDLKGSKYAGKATKFLYDAIDKSDEVGIGDGGKYGYDRHLSRKDALRRYDKEQKMSDYIETAAMIGGDFFGSDAFKSFTAGEIPFAEMMSTMSDDVKNQFAKSLTAFKTPIKSIGSNMEKLLLPNLTKDWDFGGGE